MILDLHDVDIDPALWEKTAADIRGRMHGRLFDQTVAYMRNFKDVLQRVLAKYYPGSELHEEISHISLRLDYSVQLLPRSWSAGIIRVRGAFDPNRGFYVALDSSGANPCFSIEELHAEVSSEENRIRTLYTAFEEAERELSWAGNR